MLPIIPAVVALLEATSITIPMYVLDVPPIAIFVLLVPHALPVLIDIMSTTMVNAPNAWLIVLTAKMEITVVFVLMDMQ